MDIVVSVEERKALLALARQAIFAHLTHGPRPRLAEAIAGRNLGAFVSVHVEGDLRGCIGYIQSDTPLGEVVARCAVSAAAEDPRFPPLTLSELDAADLEISVLGPIEPVQDVSEIEIGRHGLIISKGGSKGLLLPQVATEHGWDPPTFLAHTCLKAGLHRDAWKTGAKISKFEAVVFAEQRSAPPDITS